MWYAICSQEEIAITHTEAQLSAKKLERIKRKQLRKKS
jgi:hypothetical protein